MFLSSGSYVYCTGDAVNKIDPWGLGERISSPLSPHPGKTPKAEKKPQTTNNDRDRVDAPDDHERAKTNQDEMKEMFNRSSQWAANAQNRQERQRGLAVKGGLHFFGARAGGDGFVPRHFNEDGLGMSETRNATTSTTQTQQGSTADAQAEVLAAQIAFNEIAVPVTLAEPTPFGEMIVAAVNMALFAYRLQLRYSESFTEVFYDKGDPIGLERFTEKGKGGKLIDPKTKQWIEPDHLRNQGNGPHGGSWWKLYSKDGTRIGTISKDGRWLRP